MRHRSRYVAYVDENGTECCREGHPTREEAQQHAAEQMRKNGLRPATQQDWDDWRDGRLG